MYLTEHKFKIMFITSITKNIFFLILKINYNLNQNSKKSKEIMSIIQLTYAQMEQVLKFFFLE